ncbi:MAG: NFACT RNA binding domain-containing protein [Roseiflexaceae bacterium]
MSSFDALTLAAVVDELRATIIGGKIQRVVLPGPLSIAIEIYNYHRRYHLLLSAHPRFARVHLSEAKPSRGVGNETPLLLLLRKYVNGGRIIAVEQPNLERVMLLSIVKRPPQRNSESQQAEPDTAAEASESDPAAENEVDLADENLLRCELVAEIMEQRSNLILVSDTNIIMGAARRITAQMSRRVVLPGEPYELPPPQEKRDPRRISAEGVQAAIADAPPDPKGRPLAIARALVAAYRGLSPFAAREAVFRACGDGEITIEQPIDAERVATAVRDLWSGRWAPSLAGPAEHPNHYAPYLLTHLASAAPQPSISSALETFYNAREHLTDHQQRRDSLRAQIGETKDRLDRQRIALESELVAAKIADRLRWEGEMIYAFLHTIQPRQAELQIEDEQGQIQTIKLDPQKHATEIAHERFRAYDKAKSAAEGLPERLRQVELRLAGIEQTLALLAVAEGFDSIESIALEASEQGLIANRAHEPKRKLARSKPLPPLRLQSSDGLAIYVGRSSGQNEQVTFKIGAPEDLWLHVRGLPGAHVIIKNGGRSVPEQTLNEAAGLAAYFSQHREEAAVEVDFARRIQVRRIRGGPPGLVSYHADGTIRVAPRAPWEH